MGTMVVDKFSTSTYNTLIFLINVLFMKKASLIKAILALFVFSLLVALASSAQAIITSDTAEISDESDGYIVELKEIPLAVKSAELSNQIQLIKDQVVQLKKDSQGLAGSQKIATLAQIGSLEVIIKSTELKIKNDQNNHRIKLANEHNLALQSFSLNLTGFTSSGSSSKVTREYTKVFNGFALNITDAEAEKVKASPYVKSVSPNQQVRAMLMDSVPMIHADDVWVLKDSANQAITGKGITIAILDTGIDYTHPDLGGCFGPTCKVIGGYDFINNDNNPIDDMGHGTHCASIAAGNGVLKGVAPDAKLYGYKVLGSNGSGGWDDVIAGIERAVDPNQDGDLSDHVNVISMSLGAYCGKYSPLCGPDDVVARAVDNAVNSGVVAVVAAGNIGGASTIVTPGVARKAITVGAVEKNKTISSFSSKGPVLSDTFGLIKPDVVAPGVNICAARFDSWRSAFSCLDNEHVSVSGTSMAAPHVAGAVALILQAHPDWSAPEVKSVFRNTAVSINEPINTQGYGLINILAAVNSIKPPLAELSTSGKVSGTVRIMGTAKAENFSRYSLYYGQGFDPVSWTLIGSVSQQVDNGFLFAFNFQNLNDGEYVLKLVVTDTSGRSNEDRTIITVDEIKMITPESNQIIGTGSIIDISGSVSGIGFVSYTIAYAVNQTSADWRTEGISLANGGRQQVQNGPLATWNTSSLTTQFYSLRLTANYVDRTQSEYVQIFFDPRLKQGWPVYSNRSNDPIGYHPKVHDIDRDGRQEVIVVRRDSTSIYKDNGSMISGWPREGINRPAVEDFFGAPAIGNIDDDQEDEIVIGGLGSIKAFDIAGGTKTYYLPGAGIGDPGYAEYITLADLDYDGKMELVFTYYEYDPVIKATASTLTALKQVGSDFVPISGWPYKFPNSSVEILRASDPAIGDVDNDGKLEVVVILLCIRGNDMTGEVVVFSDKGLVKNRFQVFLGWQIFFDGRFAGNVILADIDSDGSLEIGFGHRRSQRPFCSLEFRRYSGDLVSGWPFNYDNEDCGINKETPIVGDPNGDGKPEVFTWRLMDAYKLFLLDALANKLPGWPKQTDNQPALTGAIIGDINGDSFQEIIKPTTSATSEWGREQVKPYEIYFLDKEGRQVEPSIKLPSSTYWATAGVTLGDVDGDQKVELVVLTTNRGSEGAVTVWDMPGTYTKSATDWPMFGYDLANTNCYNCPQSARAGALALSTAPDSPNGQVVPKGTLQATIVKANLTASGAEAIEVQPTSFNFCDPQYGGLCDLIRSKDVTNFKLVRTDTGQVVGYSNMFNVFNLARFTVTASSTIPLALKADISSAITASSVEFHFPANPDSPVSAKGLTSGLTIKPTGSARGSISFATVPPPPPTTGFTDPILVLANFGPSQGWSSQNTFPRFYADVNADSKSDIVGFTTDGVYVSLSTGSGFSAPTRWIAKFGSSSTSGGWTDQNTYPRVLADVNGDSRADIVGFATNGVFVSLSTGTSFSTMAKWLSNQFGALPTAGSWASNSLYPRLLADVNGDSKADIIGFGKDAVYVSLSTGTAFSSSAKWLANQFGPVPTSGGWLDNNTYPRLAADVNGDSKADIIGFGKLGVFVSLSTGTSFSSNTKWTSSFGTDPASGSWSSYDLYPRTAADVNSDNQADIIGFAKDGVFVALSKRTGFEALSKWSSQFGFAPAAGSWTTNDLYPRTADCWGEIVGFSGQGVYLSYPLSAPRGVMALDSKPEATEPLERILLSLKEQISALMAQAQLWTASLAR